MFKFLKSLFKMPGGNAPPMPPVASMSFPEIAQYVQQLGDLITPEHGTALTKRLYEIALYDHGVDTKYREGALELLEAVKSAMESVMQPEAVDAYRAANTFMEDNARRLGIGSLSWLIEELQVPDDEVVAFIARPEHSQLRDDFYAVLDPAVAERLKAHLTQMAAQSS